MRESVTVLVAVRDRAVWRLREQVRSVRERGADPRFLVVDYGSSKPYAARYAEACRDLGLEYARVRSEGRPWNKCHAINVGARRSTTPFIVTSDVDMLYACDPFTYCLEQGSPRRMYHVDTYWLDRRKSFSRASYAGRGNPGGFQFVDKAAFEAAGGYDERMVYWGQEDLDWPRRLGLLGYEQVWLPPEYRIYHQWHKPSEGGFRRPVNASIATMRCCYENSLIPRRPVEWGREMTAEDRPILRELERGSPYKTLSFAIDEMAGFETIDKVLDSRRLGFARLELGPRLSGCRIPLACFKAFNKLFRPLRLEARPHVNANMDYLLAILPALEAAGLRDYYLAADFSCAYLLWR